MDRYEVSVAVLTYKPNKEKLLETLESIMMQKDIRLQIVIADDGSAEPLFEVAEQFFREKNFTDYIIVDNQVNRGTVYNVQSAVDCCTGTYVKLISPGDMLVGDHILRDWVDWVCASGASLSFSDALYYIPSENGKELVSQPTHPLDVSCYLKNHKKAIQRNYLIFNDLALGAATLCRQVLLKQYIDEIAGKVCYAEDHTYRLMIYDGVDVSYFPRSAVLYETSTGVSTSGNDFWRKKLQEDWDAATAILISRPDNSSLKHRLQLLYSLPQGIKGKLVKCLYFPDMVLFSTKKKFFPRKSPSNFSKSK